MENAAKITLYVAYKSSGCFITTKIHLKNSARSEQAIFPNIHAVAFNYHRAIAQYCVDCIKILDIVVETLMTINC